MLLTDSRQMNPRPEYNGTEYNAQKCSAGI